VYLFSRVSKLKGCCLAQHPFFYFYSNRRIHMEVFHTVETIAPQLNLSVQAVYAACRNGQLPHVRIGRRIRIPETALKLWVEEQTNNENKAQETSNVFGDRS
ncbi:MAG: helix-turn-helix domain-containing protein, partial [Acidobacteriota bacterium]